MTGRKLRCGTRLLDLAQPRIMGVINVTPDSFSDGGHALRAGAADPDLEYIVDLARAMLDEGAAILDVGGESTRPGADPVSAAEEIRRVMPVIERLVELDTIVSVDTSKAEVARLAVAAGCGLVNDVRGFRDPAMLKIAAGSDVGLCVMHMQGEPRSMQHEPRYGDVVREVGAFLAQRVAACRELGVDADRILLDPGIGFGKSLAHNLALLRNLEAVRYQDQPLLVGISRKRMLGTLTGRAVDQRLVASAVAAALAAERGADILRVHDVAATRDALALVTALTSESEHDD